MSFLALKTWERILKKPETRNLKGVCHEEEEGAPV
jgi:hypothetical protein